MQETTVNRKLAKVPPHSKEAEMMVLGCMLTNINSVNTAVDLLDDSDFYFTEHRTIFSTIKFLYKSDKPADVHLVAEELKRKDKLNTVGGVSYLTTLAQFAGTSAHIEHYAHLVHDKAILRRMARTAQEIEKEAFDEPEDVFSALDDAQQKLFQISQANRASVGVNVPDLISGVKTDSMMPYLKELEKRQEDFQNRPEGDLGITGTPTNFLDLDKTINGLGNSNLIILAARPAMGKTLFALNVAANVALLSKKSVGIFSLEMGAEQLLHRLICAQSGVESEKIATGSLNGSEYQSVVSAVSEFQKHNIVIDDQPGIKITDLRARARRMKEAYDIELLVVDYLQLLSGSNSTRNSESRQHEISEISRLLKNLARELDIPIICLSQLSRRVEERTGHRPMMSDLRESGSIEQDADVVIFMLRRDYYDPMDKPGMAELIIAKNRHGAIGNINITFLKEFAKFSNYTPEAVGYE
ncbi:MAG: Replicative DNA helicase [Chlamydiae bacterium]|nr:Replicative DNA helicase [Chlamydiota bacterium]